MINIYQTLATYLTGGTDLHQLEQIDEKKAEKNPFNAIILKYMDEFEKDGFSFDISSLEPKKDMETIKPGDPIPNKAEILHIYENHTRIMIIKKSKEIHIESLYSLKELLENKKLGITVISAMIMNASYLKLNREDLNLKVTKELKTKLQRKTMFKALTNIQRFNYTNKIEENLIRIEESYTRINDIKRSIKQLEKEIKELEKDELFSDFDKDKIKIIDFLFKHSAIDQDSIRIIKQFGYYYLVFNTHRLYAYKINKNYLEKSKKEMFKNYNFEKIADGILSDDIKIDVGRYEYRIRFSNPIEFRTDSLSKAKNPHYSIGCMGTASEPYYNAIRNNEIIKAFNIHIEFLQSINFGDAGSHRLFDEVGFLHVAKNKYIKQGDEL